MAVMFQPPFVVAYQSAGAHPGLDAEGGVQHRNDLHPQKSHTPHRAQAPLEEQQQEGKKETKRQRESEESERRKGIRGRQGAQLRELRPRPEERTSWGSAGPGRWRGWCGPRTACDPLCEFHKYSPFQPALTVSICTVKP